MNTTNLINFSTKLPEDYKKELKILSVNKGVSIQELIINLVGNYIRENKEGSKS